MEGGWSASQQRAGVWLGTVLLVTFSNSRGETSREQVGDRARVSALSLYSLTGGGVSAAPSQRSSPLYFIIILRVYVCGLYARVLMSWVHICVWGHVHKCAHGCGGQKSLLIIFFIIFLLLSLELIGWLWLV